MQQPIYGFPLHYKLVIAFNCKGLGNRGYLRKILQIRNLMTIFYVKKCADLVKITLINLACDIFGLLAKNTHLCSIRYHILFNKINSFYDILVKIDIHTAPTCSNIILKFHKDICYSFWEMIFSISSKKVKPLKSVEKISNSKKVC